MKLVNVLICVALSLSFLIIGIGFAVPNATLNFTGNVSFQHTDLYISNVTTQGNVNIIGYSGTMFTLTADQGATMTVSITNPLNDPYYYLNYTAGDHTLTTTAKLGDAVPAGGTLVFTVTFDDVIDQEQMVKFNFTAVPPTLDPPGGTTGGTTNATAALEFVIDNAEWGLNHNNTQHNFETWCNSGNPILHCLDKGVTGNNLANAFNELKAQDVYYTLEWVSTTQYNIYLYYAQDAIESNKGKYLVTYKQEIVYNTTENKWMNGDSFKGYAKLISLSNNGKEFGVEHNNKNVIWTTDLPAGAEVVG